MAATIRGTFELIDRASGTLKKIEAQALKTQAAVVGVGAALDKSGGGSSGSAKALNDESKALNALEGDAKGAKKGVDDLSMSHSKLTGSTTSSSRALRDYSSVIASAKRGASDLTNETKKLADALSSVGRSAGSTGGGSSMFSSIKSWTNDLKAFTSQKSTMTQMSSAAAGVGKAFSGLASNVLWTKLPLIGSAIQPAIASIDALGGAVIALVPELEKAAGAIEAFPAGISLGVQAFGTLKLATTGVGNAISALMQSQQQFGQNQQTFGNQVQSATDAVTAAQQGLTQATYAQNQAQLQLTITRQQATRTLQDMAFAAKTSVLQEAQAGLNIQQAQQQLQQAMLTPGTSQLTLEQDRLAVMQAQADAQQTHTQAVRDRHDYRSAEEKKPTSAPILAVAQAQHQVSQSAVAVTNAERSLREAQEALNQTMNKGNAGTNAYNQALNALAPAQRQFVNFIKGSGLLAGFKGLQNAAAAGLFPAMEPQITKMIKLFPQLDSVAQKTGKALARSFNGVMQVFDDPNWITNVGDKNASILGQMSGGFKSLARWVKELIIPGQQFISWLVKIGDQWLKTKAKQDSGVKGFDALTKKFKDAEGAITRIWHVLDNLWHAFQNVTHAATGLGDHLWSSAQKGTKAWAEWTKSTQGQNDMRKYFNGLKPTLTALDKLFKAIVKDFIDLGQPGKGGQAQATNFINLLIGVLPEVNAIVKSMANWINALAPAEKVFAKIVTLMAKVTGFLTGWKPLADVLGIAFATTVLVRFINKLTGVGTILKGLRGAFRLFRGGQMPSPATGGAGGTANPIEKALDLSAQWGMRSGDGPGSEANPLAVVVLDPSGGGLGGGGSSGLGTAVKDAEEASKTERFGAFLGGKGKFGGGIAKVLGKIPGLSGITRGATGLEEGAGIVGEAASVSKFAGIADKLAPLAGFAKFAGPVGLAIAALPGIIAGITTKGSVGHRLSAAADATVSSATFGLVHLGAPSKTEQVAKGQAGVEKFVKGLPTTSSGGLTPAGIRTLQEHRSKLQRQYDYAATSHTTTMHGASGAYQSTTGPNVAVRQEDYAKIQATNKLLENAQMRAGQTAAVKWTSAFAEGVGKGEKPKTAITTMESGLTDQLKTLGPAGQKQLLTATASWGATLVAQNPQMKKPVAALNNYISGQWQLMQNNGETAFGELATGIQVVNGQILTGSTTQWANISKALTNPMMVAQEKLAGNFKAIQQAAMGQLEAMGLSKSMAAMLMKNPASAVSWGKFFTTGGAPGPSNQGSRGHGGSRAGGARAATGGRVMGSNPRDVYQYGNMALGGGELVMNRHHEMEANARLMRHGEPTVGSIVSNRNTPNWERRASGGRAQAPSSSFPAGGAGTEAAAVKKMSNLLGYARSHSGGSEDGLCLTHVEGFMEAVGYPGGTHGVGHEFAWDFGTDARAHAAAWGLEQLMSGDPYSAPPGGVVVVPHPNPGTSMSGALPGEAGDISVASGSGQFYNGGSNSYGGAGAVHNAILLAPAGYRGGKVPIAAGAWGGGRGGGGGGGGGTAVMPVWKDLKVPASTQSGIPGMMVGAATAGMVANVNALMGQGVKQYGSQIAGTTGGGVTIPGGGGAVVAQMGRVLMANGLNKIGAAGVIGNAYQESGWNPSAMEPGTHNGGLWGFTASPVSLSDMQAYATQHHKPWTDPKIQTAFLLEHITGGQKQGLNTSGSPAAAADYFMNNWEHPLVSSENAARREAGAQTAFKEGYASGGRIPINAGWFANGGTFTTNGPTVFGAGERGPETVSVTPAGGGGPVTITIQKIEVNRKGDVQKIVDEEMRILANSLKRH